MKGSYILVLQLEQPRSGLEVGRLGRFDFAAGFYLYVGSAWGPGGLAARLAHHQRPVTRPHWHIDYLRAVARLREAWSVASHERLECVWCKAFAALPSLSIPAQGFGSSDTGCPSHLFYKAQAPHPSLFTGVILGAVVAGAAAEIQIEIHSFDGA